MTALAVAFAAGQAVAVALLLAPRLLIPRHPHRSPRNVTDYPALPATTWQPPDRLPTRRSLERPLPHDLDALVRAGYVVEVEPGRFRRAPRTHTRAPATPTPRQQHDHHVDRIVRAVLAGDAPAARRHHAVARATSTSTTPATEEATTRDTHPPSTPTTDSTSTPTHTSTATTTTTSTTGASGQQPLTCTPNRQDVQPTRQSQSPNGTAGGMPPQHSRGPQRDARVPR